MVQMSDPTGLSGFYAAYYGKYFYDCDSLNSITNRYKPITLKLSYLNVNYTKGFSYKLKIFVYRTKI